MSVEAQKLHITLSLNIYENMKIENRPTTRSYAYASAAVCRPYRFSIRKATRSAFAGAS